MRFKRLTGIFLISTILLGLAAAEDQVDSPKAAADDARLALVVELGNRMYPEWRDTVRVHLDESFFLGDTEFRATFREFVSDFRILDGKVVSMSDSLANPAAHVFVFTDSGTVDSTWAFLNHPPHFSPDAFFTFRLQEIEGYEPSKAREEEGEK
jgi:hypothetical protein